MPNWCTNDIHVFGSKGEIKDFYRSIVKAASGSSGAEMVRPYSECYLSNVAEFFHFEYSDLPCRGEIYERRQSTPLISFVGWG